MKRLTLYIGLILAGWTLHSQMQLQQVTAWHIPTDPSIGQRPGAGFVGDSTICDGRGCEGNFFRIKSHDDFFDLTVWGPDPELGIDAYHPLPPHTLELRDSSNRVLVRYSNGHWELKEVQ